MAHTTTYRITGMHCASCNILVKTELKKNQKVLSVVPDQEKGILTITHTGSLTIDEVRAAVCSYGYEIASDTQTTDIAHLVPAIDKPNHTETMMLTAILLIIAYLVSQTDLHQIVTPTTTITIPTAFLLGLVASVSTCMATTGALYGTYINRVPKAAANHATFFFIFGRILAYAIGGYLIGFLGQNVLSYTHASTLFQIIISFILLILGFDMLRIVSIRQIFARLTESSLLQSFERPFSHTHFSFQSLLLGMLTYVLPCGFSLSIQTYALSLGSPLQSMYILTAFAIGTLPAMLLIALTTRIRQLTWYPLVLKTVALLVIGTSLFNLFHIAELYGYATPLTFYQRDQFEGKPAPIVDGVQQVKMTAVKSGYYPSGFILKADIPVRWEIIGQDVYGCQGTVQAPQVGVPLLTLKPGSNIVEFTPRTRGMITFSCSMGMFTGTFKVI